LLNVDPTLNINVNPKLNKSYLDGTSDEDESSDEMSVEERLEKEKKRRKLLEAQLKALKRKKNKDGNASSKPTYKIEKLEKGLSEEDKQAKVKALMDKFKKRSLEKNGISQVTSEKVDATRTTKLNKLPGLTKNASSSPKLSTSHSSKLSVSKSKSTSIHNTNATSKTSGHTDRTKKSSHANIPPSKMKPKPGLASIKHTEKRSSPSKVVPERTLKRASNPYAELMQKAKAYV